MKEIRLCDNGDLVEVAELCQEYHLGIEVQAFHDPYIENFDEVLEKHKLVLANIEGGKSLHAPFWDLNLGTKMKGIRQETMDMFNYAYKIAKSLECTEIVVHNGYIPGTSWYDGWVMRATNFWKEFFADKDDSITMCIENQFENDSELLIKEIDAVNDPRLKVCLDIGHANANSNMPVEDWITSLGDRIHYFHLHNNHGKTNALGYNTDDEHLAIGDGTIDIKRVLELAEEHCPDAIWNVETKTKYLEKSITLLQEMNYINADTLTK